MFFRIFFFVWYLLAHTKDKQRNVISASCKMPRYFCSTANTFETDQQITVKFDDFLPCRSSLSFSRFTCRETDVQTWRGYWAQHCSEI